MANWIEISTRHLLYFSIIPVYPLRISNKYYNFVAI